MVPRTGATPQQPQWARRVRQHRIRELYRGEREGRLDEGLLIEVGWALWERARDVAAVSTAMVSGWVKCPECGAEARRRRREYGPGGGKPPPVICKACGYQGDWHGVRETLRRRPRCLDCATPLEWDYAKGIVSCPTCGVDLPFRTYRQRLRGRKGLPCPHCQAILRQPERTPKREAHTPGGNHRVETVMCPHCREAHPWRDVRASWRLQPRCTCGEQLTESDGRLSCADCGKAWTRARFSRRLSRRRTGPCPSCGKRIAREPDTVRCTRCGWEGRWNSFRRTWRGQSLQTGAGLPACEQFVVDWPECPNASTQMARIDSFLHELHDGPLAPLFIAGGKQAVVALLDELGGIKRTARDVPRR